MKSHLENVLLSESSVMRLIHEVNDVLLLLSTKKSFLCLSVVTKIVSCKNTIEILRKNNIRVSSDPDAHDDGMTSIMDERTKN